MRQEAQGGAMPRDGFARDKSASPISLPRSLGPHRRRRIGIAAGLALLLIALGCMSFSIESGERVSWVGNEAVLEQKGMVSVKDNDIVCVYYPIPYASPPNLPIEDTFQHYTILDQKPEYFRVRNEGGWPNVKWTARGLKAPPPSPPPVLVKEGPPPVVVPETAPPPHGLPPEPVPVEPKK
jgi:hypothetical protein